jgi:hypothetical protein
MADETFVISDITRAFLLPDSPTTPNAGLALSRSFS